MTTQQIKNFKNSGEHRELIMQEINTIAQYVISEPNYGVNYSDPSTLDYTNQQIQSRVNSYWQKRYNLANRIVQNPNNIDLWWIISAKLLSGSSAIGSPISFDAEDQPVYTIWDVNNENDGVAGFIKNTWNDLAGVKSNEYPWAGENGTISEPDPNWYTAHYSTLPNRF
jgi:hypothetical protein